MGSFNLPDRERKPGSIGVPIGGTEFRLVDDDGNDVPAGEPGEIAMRGPFVMRGYWERDDATRDTIATAGSTPATWRPSTTTATTSSSTARRS